MVPYAVQSDEVYVVGSTAELGNWKIDNAVQLSHVGGREFCSAALNAHENAEYKFVIKHGFNNYTWENGENRKIDIETRIVNGFFRYPYEAQPRFAGVNIPVFSINTKSSYGCGEFLDLKVLADFCVKAGMKVIQILPVFDAMNTMTWVDSYPYGAITVFALHPMYCNISAVKGCSQEILDEIENTRDKMIVD